MVHAIKYIANTAIIAGIANTYCGRGFLDLSLFRSSRYIIVQKMIIEDIQKHKNPNVDILLVLNGEEVLSCYYLLPLKVLLANQRSHPPCIPYKTSIVLENIY